MVHSENHRFKINQKALLQVAVRSLSPISESGSGNAT